MTARLSTTASTLILLGGLTAATAALAATPAGIDLTATSPIVRAQAAAPAAATGGTVTVRTSYANLRAEPTTKSAKVGRVNHGAKLQVIGTSGDWTQVQVGDKTGYVNNKLLTR